MRVFQDTDLQSSGQYPPGLESPANEKYIEIIISDDGSAVSLFGKSGFDKRHLVNRTPPNTVRFGEEKTK